MNVRNWTPGFLLAVIVLAWGAALLLGAVSSELDDWDLVFFIAAALALVASGVATAWSWNRVDIRSWHVGKVVVLWGVLLLTVWSFHSVDEDLTLVPLILGGVPLLVLTWAWLGGRERAT